MPDGRGAKSRIGKAVRTRREIRTAAADLFGRKTYLDTTMDEIAAAAGVSKGGLYYHYRKKSDVLFDIKCRAMEDLFDGLEDELAAIPTSREKLRHLIERQILYYSDNLPEVRTLLRDRYCMDAEQEAIVADLETRYFDFTRAIVSDAIGSTEPARVNPIAFGLFGLCNWIPGWFRNDGPTPVADLARDTARLFLEGLDSFCAREKDA